jgi:hypothetical protein
MGEPPFGAARNVDLAAVDLAAGGKPCGSSRQHPGIEV